MRGIRLRRVPDFAVLVGKVYLEEPYLGKALALGMKVLLDREFGRLTAFAKEGKVGEAGAYALVIAKSPLAFKFPNRPAPKDGWREMDPVLERVMASGDAKAMERAVKVKAEGDEAEVLLLLELLEVDGGALVPEVVKAVGEHIPEDRRHKASEVVPPFMERKPVAQGG